MKKTLYVLLCVILCMTVGSVAALGGQICEKPVGESGEICGGNITVTKYIDWTPKYYQTPCTEHSRYDHWQTTFEKGSTMFEACSACGNHRFIQIDDAAQYIGEMRIECTDIKKGA